LTKLEDKTIKEEETVEFKCKVSKPDVKVKWVLNGQRLVAGENIEIISKGDERILKIKDCQLSDNGQVSCILPGEKFSQANLIVEG
jgi:hypothetical protein